MFVLYSCYGLCCLQVLVSLEACLWPVDSCPVLAWCLAVYTRTQTGLTLTTPWWWCRSLRSPTMISPSHPSTKVISWSESSLSAYGLLVLIDLAIVFYNKWLNTSLHIWLCVHFVVYTIISVGTFVWAFWSCFESINTVHVLVRVVMGKRWKCPADSVFEEMKVLSL